MEFDGEDTFYGWVVGLEKEFGSFSLSELKSVSGPMGLKIERDIHFRPKPISQVMKEHGETHYQAMTVRKSFAYKIFRVSDGKLISAGNKKDILKEFKRLGGTKAGYRFFFTGSETMPRIAAQYSTTEHPQTEEKVTPKELEFAETMWETTFQLVKEGEPRGIHIWRMLEHFYPGNRTEQVSTLGFMNDIYGRYGPGPVPQEELVKSAKKWNVEKLLVEEMLKFLPQLHEMSKKVWIEIVDPGATSFQKGATISWQEFEKEDKKVRERGEKPASVKIIKQSPQGNGNGHKNIPATIEGEPLPEKYRELGPFIDEPLPLAANILLPAVEAAEGERKIDVVLKQLQHGVEGIQDSERFRLFLTTMSKFHDYSIGNIILIGMQKPEAQRVAGFQTWKKLGRWVKKGEKGIAIMAPMMPPKAKKEEDEEEEEKKVALAPVFFKVVHVFDISQTEGKPLPEFEVPSLTGEANEELFAKALALSNAQGVDVSFESKPQMDPAIKGYYSNEKIWVRPEEPRAQQLKTLLHELSHYYTESVFKLPRRDAETIAESAAFTIGAHFGFDSGVRSFPYVALWAEDKKVLQANLLSIRKVATVILDGMETPAVAEGKLIPALQPFEPYNFAEYVLRYNRFSDAEIPIYSGLTGRNPLRLPDHIWREVIKVTEGEFVKQGDISIFHIPEKERPPYMRAAPTWRDITSTIPEGTCYEDAWRFLLKEEEGDLVHGSVQTIGKRINHAWVELPTGFIWEPESGELMKKDYFYQRAKPEVQARYTTEEASIMAARTKNLGPWTDEERARYLTKELAVIPNPTPLPPPSPKDELEFVSDSPELIPFTIEDIGYRDKLDKAFETAIAGAKGG